MYWRREEEDKKKHTTSQPAQPSSFRLQFVCKVFSLFFLFSFTGVKYNKNGCDNDDDKSYGGSNSHRHRTKGLCVCMRACVCELASHERRKKKCSMWNVYTHFSLDVCVCALLCRSVRMNRRHTFVTLKIATDSMQEWIYKRTIRESTYRPGDECFSAVRCFNSVVMKKIQRKRQREREKAKVFPVSVFIQLPSVLCFSKQNRTPTLGVIDYFIACHWHFLERKIWTMEIWECLGFLHPMNLCNFLRYRNAKWSII